MRLNGQLNADKMLACAYDLHIQQALIHTLSTQGKHCGMTPDSTQLADRTSGLSSLRIPKPLLKSQAPSFFNAERLVNSFAVQVSYPSVKAVIQHVDF